MSDERRREPPGELRGDAYRDPGLVAALAGRVRAAASELGRPLKLMHICGTHEHALGRYALRDLLPLPGATESTLRETTIVDAPRFGYRGFQLDVARNVLGLGRANSTEIDPNTPYPVIDLMPDQRDVDMGGTMRLGH